MASSAIARRRTVLVAAWAVGGLALTFVEAVVRLGARALDTVGQGLDGGQWLALIALVVLLGYFEGYRALQRRFAPRVVARALEAGARLAGCFPVLAAPAYALGLFGAPRRELLRTWLGLGLIALAVLLVRALPFPWRGIVDGGVAVALSWGLGAVLVQLMRALRSEPSGQLSTDEGADQQAG